jgi:hypothetical protein
MNSFLATDASTPDPTVIENEGWFPDIALQHMRDAMRLDGTVTEPRLQQAVIGAILHVNNELADWQEEQQIAGYALLADVPAPQIGGESKLLACYRRAVYSWAKADLIERYSDYDTTADGKKKAESLDCQIDEQRRNTHWAVADMIGRPHRTVELI